MVIGAEMMKLILAFFAFVTLLAPAGEHAEIRHGTAASNARGVIEDDKCQPLEVWYSPARGTLLFACKNREVLGRQKPWALLIYGINDGNGGFRDPEHIREVTCFNAKTRYFRKVLVRDGYMPLWMRGDVLDYINDAADFLAGDG